MMWNWTAGCCDEKRLSVDKMLAANVSSRSLGNAGYDWWSGRVWNWLMETMSLRQAEC
jgi:hypothetical protein